jgi:multidrug efflux pump subunit AcrA (membrane-fusion protein)
MRWKLVAAVALAAVGIGAVGLVVIGPTLGSSSATRYLTSQAVVTDVTKQVVATGTVSAHETYGLGFGRDPQLVASSSSSSSAASSGGGSGGSTTWVVTTVDVGVGDSVTKGATLASADAADAQLQLSVAQANLASAEAKLATDKAGPTSAEKASAYDQVKQASQQLTSSRQNLTDTRRQNSVALSQAKAAVTAAERQLAADEAAGAPANVISADQAAVTKAKQDESATSARVTASNNQASNQVTSASLSLSAAKNTYQTRIAPATAAQIAADEAQVASAKVSVANAQAAFDGAVIVAPEAGIVTAVDIVPGTTAPSGDAIRIAVPPLEVQASVAESDLPSIKVGQTATVTVAAIGRDVEGKVAEIDPTASSSGGGQSSVVTYTVVITLTGDTTDVAAGMSADVNVTTASATNVVAVPSTALSGTTGAYRVRVIDSAGQVESRSVEVGIISTSLVEITSGISAGDTVVVGTSSTRTGTSSSGTNSFGRGGFGGGGIDVPGGGRVFQP